MLEFVGLNPIVGEVHKALVVHGIFEDVGELKLSFRAIVEC